MKANVIHSNFKLSKIYLLCSLTIILSFLSFPPVGISLFSFVIFVPLLTILINDRLTYFKKIITIWITIFLSNVSLSFWVLKLSIPGALLYWLVSSTFQTLPFIIALLFLRKNEKSIAYIVFVGSWILQEGIQLHIDFSFPLFILGNSFAKTPYIIKWYSITGVLGGSLWILVLNVMIFKAITEKSSKAQFISPIIFFVLPVVFSLILKEPATRVVANTIIVHPNINCYSEKFQVSSNELIDSYSDLTFEKLSSSIDLIVWPETAITNFGWVENIPNDNTTLWRLITSFKTQTRPTLITGGVIYEKASESSPGAAFSRDQDVFYHIYNAAIGINFKNKQIDIRAKEKLVPIEEYQPFPFLTKYLSYVYSSLSGLKFNKKTRNHNVFKVGSEKILPLICFETLYGSFISSISTNTTGIVLLMNEGWYDNLWASSQFFLITRIRALEQQKDIIVSSNRGTSGLIGADGKIKEMFNERKKTSIMGQVNLNRTKTFYSVYGDYLIILSLVIISFSLLIFFLKTLIN